MLYAVLCFHDEDIVAGFSDDELKSVLDDMIAVQEKWGPRFRPVLRLKPSKTAKRVKAGKRVVTDGPFAETKEQLLGIHTLDVVSPEQALEIVAELSAANPTAHYELRPLFTYITDAYYGDSLLNSPV